MPSKSRLSLSFIVAVLLAATLGSIVQTQHNLAALQALGAPVPLDVRLSTTILDIVGFGPTFALLAILGFIFALPVAVWSARRLPLLHWSIFALAGALAIWCALNLANAIAPMPTLIAADRTGAGTLGLMASGALGSLAFALIGVRRAPARVASPA